MLGITSEQRSAPTGTAGPEDDDDPSGDHPRRQGASRRGRDQRPYATPGSLADQRRQQIQSERNQEQRAIAPQQREVLQRPPRHDTEQVAREGDVRLLAVSE